MFSEAPVGAIKNSGFQTGFKLSTTGVNVLEVEHGSSSDQSTQF